MNLQIQTNVIDSSFRHGVKKLLFLGSSCIYPKFAPQPMKEEYLLSGKLVCSPLLVRYICIPRLFMRFVAVVVVAKEPTNDAYALAKIAGIVMCKSYNRQHGTNYIAAMPTNLYGPGDNYHLQGKCMVQFLFVSGQILKSNRFSFVSHFLRFQICSLSHIPDFLLDAVGNPREALNSFMFTRKPRATGDDSQVSRRKARQCAKH